ALYRALDRGDLGVVESGGQVDAVDLRADVPDDAAAGCPSSCALRSSSLVFTRGGRGPRRVAVTHGHHG
ncbi:hypothetical protein, partial [Streptomyces scabiei]|uniref:hypothetical protein n=1 Tax=Streptomyces scabiei TaxID=1930 RepID=UPI0029A24B11